MSDSVHEILTKNRVSSKIGEVPLSMAAEIEGNFSIAVGPEDDDHIMIVWRDGSGNTIDAQDSAKLTQAFRDQLIKSAVNDSAENDVRADLARTVINGTINIIDGVVVGGKLASSSGYIEHNPPARTLDETNGIPAVNRMLMDVSPLIVDYGIESASFSCKDSVNGIKVSELLLMPLAPEIDEAFLIKNFAKIPSRFGNQDWEHYEMTIQFNDNGTVKNVHSIAIPSSVEFKQTSFKSFISFETVDELNKLISQEGESPSMEP